MLKKKKRGKGSKCDLSISILRDYGTIMMIAMMIIPTRKSQNVLSAFSVLGIVIYEVSTGATITKYLRQGGLNNRNLFSHSSGGWKSKVKVSARLVSSEASLLAL